MPVLLHFLVAHCEPPVAIELPAEFFRVLFTRHVLPPLGVLVVRIFEDDAGSPSFLYHYETYEVC